MEAFGKKAVFGDEEEEEDRIEEDDRYDNDILKIREKKETNTRRHIIQGVDVTSFPIFKISRLESSQVCERSTKDKLEKLANLT